jgi:hypothetical protein
MDGGMTDDIAEAQAITVHDGEMQVPLGDGTVILTANLRAAKAISRHFGGFQQALNKMAAGDLEAFIAVVRFGVGDVNEHSARRLEERVFQAGVLRLTAPLTEYVLICANGGKPIAEAAAETAPGKENT